MSKKAKMILRIADQGMHREQELCIEATESGQYDQMSDEEWVRLCEKISRESEVAAGLSQDLCDN